MNATDIIGFTADADIWCQDCATRVYGAEIMTSAVEDSEGNEVRPIFADDAADFDHCGNCGAELVEHDCADHDETFGPYLESFTQHYAVAMLWANTQELSTRTHGRRLVRRGLSRLSTVTRKPLFARTATHSLGPTGPTCAISTQCSAGTISH